METSLTRVTATTESKMPRVHETGSQAIQAIYKITVLEEYAKIIDFTSVITVGLSPSHGQGG